MVSSTSKLSLPKGLVLTLSSMVCLPGPTGGRAATRVSSMPRGKVIGVSGDTPAAGAIRPSGRWTATSSRRTGIPSTTTDSTPVISALLRRFLMPKRTPRSTLVRLPRV